MAHAVAVVAGRLESVEAELFPAWDGLGIVQHHDAMPGTMSTKGAYTSWGDTPPYHSGDADKDLHCLSFLFYCLSMPFLAISLPFR